MFFKSVTQSKAFKSLTKIVKNGLLSSAKKPEHDLIFIRHAESEFNTACEDYRQAHNIPYIWKELCNHEGFDQKVLFNKKFMDCQITERGKADCIQKRNLLKDENIDCVLVSPQIRALQTCHYLFKDRKIPVIVQPLLVGPLRSCSDINKSIEYKKLIFPQYNFGQTKKYQELWYLDYLNDEQRKICVDRFAEKKLETVDDKRLELLQLLKEGKIYEDAHQYRKRIDNVKERIGYYKSVFNRIAVVSHYYTIEYIGAKEYLSTGDPNFCLDVQNCTPYYAQTNMILSLTQQNSKASHIL